MRLGDENLILVGARASGKTTLGRELAERLGRPFVDLDHELAEQVGRAAEDFLAEAGEAAFREVERGCLVRAADARGRIVATGGGAVLHAAAFGRLAATGRVVFLQASLELLLERQRRAPRVRLRKGGLRAEIEELLAEREPLYRAAADITVSMDRPDPILAVLSHLGEG